MDKISLNLIFYLSFQEIDKQNCNVHKKQWYAKLVFNPLLPGCLEDEDLVMLLNAGGIDPSEVEDEG